MNGAVNYEKEKRKATIGIVASAIVLMLALSMGLTGLFFYLDATAQAARAQQREEWFDPWTDSSKMVQDAWRKWEIIGLTDEFASDFKETYHYYFAFDTDWYPFIIKMKGDLSKEFAPYQAYVYEDGAGQPAPMTVKGIVIPIEDDIREFAIECLNILYDEEFVTEENFESYMGISLLDMSEKPMGQANFNIAKKFFIIGWVLGVMSVILLVIYIKNWKSASQTILKRKETMQRLAAWQSNPDDAVYQYEDGGNVWSGGMAGEKGGESVWGGGLNEAGKSTWGNSTGSQVHYSDGTKTTQEKKSNVFLGIIGAVAGSMVGVVLWVGISQIGFIAGIAGLIMLRLALKGYEKLSGYLDKKGAVISLVITGCMIAFASVADYVIVLCRVFFVWDPSLETILYVINNFSALMTQNECWGSLVLNLTVGYGLSIWSSYHLIGEIFSNE